MIEHTYAITIEYGAWQRDYGDGAGAAAARLAMTRALRARLNRALLGLRYTPQVGDVVVTLRGDNDCDERGEPREALPMAVGRIVEIDDDRYHVVFDESCVWVCLSPWEIHDPEQYTWRLAP